MAIFRKKIATPGVVLPKNPLGQRKVEIISSQMLEEAAAEGNQMLADGMLIPAPYGHTDDNGVYPLPLVKNTSGSLVDAKTGEQSRWDHAVNSGFWKGFEIDPVDNGLVGLLDAEGDENDVNSHAGRIGKTFRQTSPFIMPEWTGGSGKKYKNALLHICVTNRGVQDGQDNFELVRPAQAGSTTLVPDADRIAKQGLTSPELAIAMSLDPVALDLNEPINQPTAISSGTIGKIKKLLEEKLKLRLPDDTNVDNFADRLETILYNMDPIEADDDYGVAPDGSRIVAPVIMAQAVPNSTPAPGQVPANNAIVNADDIVIPRKQHEALLLNAKATVKDRITSTVDKLRKAGRMTKDYAEKVVAPQLEKGIALSLDDINEDGSIAKTPLELSLDMLEQAPSMIGEVVNAGPDAKLPGYVPADAADMGDGEGVKELSSDDVDEIWNSAIGR